MKSIRVPIRDAIQMFDQSNVADGLAKSTLDNQRSHARKLDKAVFQWEQQHKRWKPMWTDEADSQLVSNYLARCVGGNGNRGNMLTYLRGFFAYCERNDWLPAGTKDKLLWGKKSKGNQRKPKVYIDPIHFPELLNCQTKHPSHRVTMALLLWTLCRKSELYALRWKNVDFQNRVLHVYRVKTKRWTKVGICPELYAELLIYEAWYAEEMDCPDDYSLMDPEWHVLPELIPVRGKNELGKYDGTCVSYTINPDRHPFHMEKIVKHGLDAIGIAGTESGKTIDHLGEGAHTIRRSGARAMLKHLSAEMGYGDALATVAAMLDHQDVKVTLKYIGMEKQKDELNEWLKTNSPYGRAMEGAVYPWL